MKAFFQLLIETFKEWKADNAPKQSAALAYYTVFSLAPLVSLIFLLLGLIYAQSDISDIFLSQISGLIGESGSAMQPYLNV